MRVEQDIVSGTCMRCGKSTTRIVLVGCVCDRCATDVDVAERAKKRRRAARWLSGIGPFSSRTKHHEA